MFNNNDPFKENKLQFLKLIIILMPIIGCIPAFWTLYQSQSSSSEKKVSRISVNLAMIWLIAYILLWLGSFNTSDLINFRLMYLNGLITSGYFIVSVFCMLIVWRGKLPSFPHLKITTKRD